MNPHQRNDSRNNLFHSSGYGDTIIVAREDAEQAKSYKYYLRWMSQEAGLTWETSELDPPI